MNITISDRNEQIQREYDREIATEFVATTAEETPRSYESITPVWLTAILCPDIPGAKVIGCSLGEPDDGTSNRRRIYVEYNTAGQAANLPPSIFCKSSQKLVHRQLHANLGTGRSEVAFYNQYRAMFDIEAPNPILAIFSPISFNAIIVLDDLARHGAAFCTHQTVFTRERIEDQLTSLAELHGRYHDGPEVANADRIMTFEQIFQTTDDWLRLEIACDKGFGAAQSVIPERLFRRRAELWEPTLKSVAINAALPRTFTHGDVHPRNWYIASDGRMGLSDWQTFCKGHWGRDLGYVLSSNLTIENRRLWEQDLITFYLEKLREAGGPKVAFDDAWKYYRQHLLSALTWWTVTNAPPDNAPAYFQPEPATLCFLGRMTTAIDDLDAVDCFD